MLFNMILFLVPYCEVCFFFFSSRRRHTRLQGDWSSDVCSSDLSDPRVSVHSVHSPFFKSPILNMKSRPQPHRGGLIVAPMGLRTGFHIQNWRFEYEIPSATQIGRAHV